MSDETQPYSGIKSLGQQVKTFEGFDVFPTAKGIESVTLMSNELIAYCPITQQIDFYSVEISYRPHQRILESKTFKLYLHSFVDKGVFGEHLAAKMCHDLVQTLEPDDLTVTLVQNPRGGISIKTVANSSRFTSEVKG